MATATPLHHPLEDLQTANLYPFRLAIYDKARNANIVENEPCAYEAVVRDDKPGALQAQSDSDDQIRVPRWIGGLKAKQIAIVSMGEAGVKRFNVQDVLPIGAGPDAMLLLVSGRN